MNLREYRKPVTIRTIEDFSRCRPGQPVVMYGSAGVYVGTMEGVPLVVCRGEDDSIDVKEIYSLVPHDDGIAGIHGITCTNELTKGDPLYDVYLEFIDNSLE